MVRPCQVRIELKGCDEVVAITKNAADGTSYLRRYWAQQQVKRRIENEPRLLCLVVTQAI